MYPFAHLYVAEKHFGKLTNEIAAGSVAPDFLALFPNFTFEETHKTLINYEDSDFKEAYNLHIAVDEFTELGYCYQLAPKSIKREVGEHRAHLFIEAAFDNIMWTNGLFFDPPKFEKKDIQNLENYFDKYLCCWKLTNLIDVWGKNYSRFLINSLILYNMKHFQVFADKDINDRIDYCVDILQNQKHSIEDILEKINF
ncbi:hypothetical protein GF374_01305 [Candidatus Woesearchaeota archaeon]|nr:hypothetical protein [Candidatus Woesearchaeota archaeon]